METFIDDGQRIQEFNRKSGDHQQLRSVLQTKSSNASAIYYEQSRQGVSLIELMGLSTFVSIGMAAVFNWGILGALLCFLIAALWSLAIRMVEMHPGKIRFLTQLIWGMIMPAFCLLADPYFFATMKNGRPIEFNASIAMPAYLGHVYLFCLVAVSMFLKPRSLVILHAYVSGGLMACSLMFCLLTFCLIPAILLGALALVGVLGISPLITGIVLIHSSLMHRRWAEPANRWSRLVVWWIGLVVPIVLWMGLVTAAENGAFDMIYENLLD